MLVSCPELLGAEGTSDLASAAAVLLLVLVLAMMADTPDPPVDSEAMMQCTNVSEVIISGTAFWGHVSEKRLSQNRHFSAVLKHVTACTF